MAVSKAKPAAKKVTVAPKISTEKKPAVKKPAASKTAAAKPPSPKTVTAKPKNSKSPAAKAAKGNGKAHITPEQRYRMICDAAYFRAERRGFVGGHPGEDWVAAEAEVDELLRSMQS
jgi:hypothetical protein